MCLAYCELECAVTVRNGNPTSRSKFADFGARCWIHASTGNWESRLKVFVTPVGTFQSKFLHHRWLPSHDVVLSDMNFC